jgi:NADPH-ferrihemoprotein reductase
MERAKLFEICENRELFTANVDRCQKTLVCILEEFTSVKLPLEVAFGEILRPIAVRYYSISSSSNENPDVLSLTAVVVRYAIQQEKVMDQKMKKAVLKEGLATSWLEKMHDESGDQGEEFGKMCPISIRTSTFRLPKDNLTPVIMIGPGTGVAPFRGFIRERYHAACQGEAVGPTWLFFGCRNENSDYLYKDEFNQIIGEINAKGLDFDFRVITAFSRDSLEKVYVQHRVKEHGNEVWSLLHENQGYFYICGDGKHMAHDVNQALEQLCMEKGDLSNEGAKTWIKSLKAKGRYHEDVW